ncbi:MAG: hypothetical protein AB1894_20615 [Chloroflexota bacterium]
MLVEAEIREKLHAFLLKEILRNPAYPLRDDEPLITGGLINSFALVQVAAFIERELGVYLPDREFTVEKMDTLDQMVARVLKA